MQQHFSVFGKNIHVEYDRALSFADKIRFGGKTLEPDSGPQKTDRRGQAGRLPSERIDPRRAGEIGKREKSAALHRPDPVEMTLLHVEDGLGISFS